MKIKPVFSAVILGAVIFSGLAAAPSAEAATKTVAHCPGHKDPRGYIWPGTCYWWPGYDTDTSGTHQSYNWHLADAWESFDALQSPPFFDDSHILRYVHTVKGKRPHAKPGQIVIPNINARSSWIVFQYVKPARHRHH